MSFYPQLGHVPPEPVVLHTIRFLRQSFFQHSSHTMITPRSLWLAESKVRSSPFFPQSLHSPILYPSSIPTCFHFLKTCICIKINFTIAHNLTAEPVGDSKDMRVARAPRFAFVKEAHPPFTFHPRTLLELQK